MEVLPNQRFKIMIYNLSEKPIHIRNRMIVALGVEMPSQIVEIAQHPRETEVGIDPVRTVPHCKQNENRNTNPDLHRVVNIEDEDRLQRNWEDELNFNQNYSEER